MSEQDVKENVQVTEGVTTGESETSGSEGTNETTQDQGENQGREERMVPLSAVQQERQRRQEAQRELARIKAEGRAQGIDPNDYEAVMSSPFVQELMIKQAKLELTDFARDELEKYPNIPTKFKKQMLKNIRGFVNETTTDVELAKVDILDSIEDLAQDFEPERKIEGRPSEVVVAPTNAGQGKPGSRPNEIQKVLNKGIFEMTDDDFNKVDNFKRNAK